jgi:TolA-binding protein
MRGIPAQHGLKKGLFLAFALAAGLSLGACSDIDNLFGGDETEMAEPAPSAAPPDAGAPPTAGPAVPLPTTAGAAPVATITPVTIESGPDTGTAVNKTVQSLRAQVAGLQQRLAANSGRVAELRNQGAGAAGAYQEAKAHITTRLQVGTTRGNPELVAEWNTAQGQLDALSANLNAMNGVGTDVTNDSSTAHFALDQISATFNVSGAVDEDHRQLQLLEDETSQTIVMIDRLLKEVSEAIQRQTAYIASERANLTTLAAAIKNGDFYGGSVAGGLGSGGVQSAVAGTPLVVVRFDRPNVDYQQILYAALNQALQTRPSASFQVVAVAPTRGNAASVQIAQSTARRHAEAVMRSMTDMGVPATRVGVASTTDPSATVSEVRVFVR